MNAVLRGIGASAGAQLWGQLGPAVGPQLSLSVNDIGHLGGCRHSTVINPREEDSLLTVGSSVVGSSAAEKQQPS
jgi:hypothetical protein